LSYFNRPAVNRLTCLLYVCPFVVDYTPEPVRDTCYWIHVSDIPLCLNYRQYCRAALQRSGSQRAAI